LSITTFISVRTIDETAYQLKNKMKQMKQMKHLRRFQF
jgi:hypothetical protein